MRTKVYTAISAALLLASTGAIAEDTIPLKAVNKANEVIDAVIEAYGGAEAISNINTVTRKSEFTTWATNQSLRPGPPWDEGIQMNFAAVDFENETFVGKQKGSGGGFDFHARQIVKGEEGWNIDYRAGTVTEAAQPDFDTSSGPLIRVSAPLLVKQLQERRNTSHWLGETEFDGRVHDVVTLVMEVGPALSLYFDRETRMLSRSERVLPPFGQIDYRFSDYEKVDGIPFASSFKLFANDQPNLVIEYASTKVNEPIEQYASIPEDMEVVEGIAQPTEVALQEVEEGVFLVGAQGTYAMFVEMDDHVVAIGGTAGIPERIAKLRETVEDKPIKFGVLTHHHNDHLVGVTAYEEEGVPIFTVAEHEEVVRSNAADGEALKLMFVEDKYVFEGGNRKLELIDIGPTPHSEHLVVAYLPDEGILFEADHFPNPINGRMPPAQPVTRHLAKAIDDMGLNVKTIVGAHSPRIASIADLRRSLALKPAVEMAASP
jgi:glyoxylase-like metal-dependent hydrolase (beta-lactamase superfamily II)